MDTTALLDWYAAHRRELPWRDTRNPYLIWISEVILQQTRVAQGLEYYLRFAERFPRVSELAAAPQDRVLLCWQGLGYYSRARNLHAAARQVMEELGGEFPSDYQTLLGLRGVGAYTAAAVSSFAADAPYAVVDGNVYRVLSRQFDIETPIDSTAGKREFAEVAQELLNQYLAGSKTARSSQYNQAIMELGALLCSAKSPDCPACPIAASCLALKANAVASRPAKTGRTTQRPRYFHYLDLTDPTGHTLLHRREGRDIWQGLYEFPLIETAAPAAFEALHRTAEFKALVPKGYVLEESVAMPKHILSHQVIHAVFHRLRLPTKLSARGERYKIVPRDQLGAYALPRLIDRYLNR